MASMNDPLTFTLPYHELATLLATCRSGIETLMGKEALTRVWETRTPTDGVQISTIFNREVQKILDIYFKLDSLEGTHRALIEATINEQLEQVRPAEVTAAMRFRTKESLDPVEFAVCDIEFPIQIGQDVKYIGEECALKPGHVYQIDGISEQDSGVFLRVNDGYHRLVDFDLNLTIEKGDTVIYTGFDQNVGDETIFTVQNRRHWGGTPYLEIRTSTQIDLAYPMADFRLMGTHSQSGAGSTPSSEV